MNELLKLLGQEAYDKLKAALGDRFDAFKQQFLDNEISSDDVLAKQTELGLLVNDDELLDEETEDTDDEKTEDTGDDENNDNVEVVDDEKDDGLVDDDVDVEETSGDDEGADDVVSTGILTDGWLLEDGNVDYDKIGDEVLVDYIKGLHGRLKQSEWDYKYKMAIMMEAMSASMYDTSDAEKYITTDNLTVDEDGNVIGVKEAFTQLKSDKPHLFKAVKPGSDNPLDGGFNPVDNKVTSKPKSYAEAVEQTRALLGK